MTASRVGLASSYHPTRPSVRFVAQHADVYTPNRGRKRAEPGVMLGVYVSKERGNIAWRSLFFLYQIRGMPSARLLPAARSLVYGSNAAAWSADADSGVSPRIGLAAICW